MLNDGKTTLKVSRNNKATLRDLVPMLLTSIRRGGGRGGEVGGEINNWTDMTLSDRGETETNIL